MRAKVILVLFIIVLLLIVVYTAALVFGVPRAEAPASSGLRHGEPAAGGSTFRGPTGLPYVRGPTAPLPASPGLQRGEPQ